MTKTERKRLATLGADIYAASSEVATLKRLAVEVFGAIESHTYRLQVSADMDAILLTRNFTLGTIRKKASQRKLVIECPNVFTTVVDQWSAAADYFKTHTAKGAERKNPVKLPEMVRERDACLSVVRDHRKADTISPSDAKNALVEYLFAKSGKSAAAGGGDKAPDVVKDLVAALAAFVESDDPRATKALRDKARDLHDTLSEPAN